MSNSSDMTASSLGMPRADRKLPGRHRLARATVPAGAGNIRVGSLAIHDGGETFHFGDPDDSTQPHAEVHVHDSSLYPPNAGWWQYRHRRSLYERALDLPNLVAVMRLFSANLATLELLESQRSWLVRLGLKLSHALKRNTREDRARTSPPITTWAIISSNCSSIPP